MVITRREEGTLEEVRVKCEYCDEGKPGRRTIAEHEEQCEFCGGTGKRMNE